MSELDDIYSAEWFAHDFRDLRPEFDMAAQCIVEVLRPETAFDVGCGPGMLVEALAERGVSSHGFDGSKHAIEYASPLARSLICQADIRTSGAAVAFEFAGLVDVMICTEVAEHLDAQDADGLVGLLCCTLAPWVVFTAAPPGQDGHHHVNCQPPEYWAARFNRRGYKPDKRKTADLKTAWLPLKRLSHMTRNVVVFRKGET